LGGSGDVAGDDQDHADENGGTAPLKAAELVQPAFISPIIAISPCGETAIFAVISRWHILSPGWSSLLTLSQVNFDAAFGVGKRGKGQRRDDRKEESRKGGKV
jgi:hypothetical protein